MAAYGEKKTAWQLFFEKIPNASYFVQAGISFSVILFSMIQLTRGEESKVYLPVITGTAAYWLPNPKTDATLKSESALETLTGVAATINAKKDTSAELKAEHNSKLDVIYKGLQVANIV